VINQRDSACRRGFTLLELLIVLAILAMLMAVVTPEAFGPLHRSKGVVLRKDLQVMRDAIDRFQGDKGSYPASLEQLVSAGYLRAIPVNPVTGNASSWLIVPPPPGASGAVFDVKPAASTPQAVLAASAPTR